MTLRTVLVVGANGGAGYAVAERLLREGVAVVATVSRPEKVQALVDALPACSDVFALDLADPEKVKKQLDRILSGLDHLDGVVVCAAATSFAPAETYSLPDFEQILSINCVSNLAIYQATIAALRETTGRIVLTGSASGRIATPLMGAYVASKFALEGLVDVMRLEASSWGVEVVLLQPGAIDTPMTPRARDEVATKIPSLSGRDSEFYRDLYLQTFHRLSATPKPGAMTSPEQFAEVAYEALTARSPDTRYRIGADTTYLFNARHEKSDRELDALILKSYRSAVSRG